LAEGGALNTGGDFVVEAIEVGACGGVTIAMSGRKFLLVNGALTRASS